MRYWLGFFTILLLGGGSLLTLLIYAHRTKSIPETLVNVILMVLTLFFYNENLQYKNKLELTYQQVYHQNQMIQVLFNTLPQAEVRGSLENTIIVTPQM